MKSFKKENAAYRIENYLKSESEEWLKQPTTSMQKTEKLDLCQLDSPLWRITVGEEAISKLTVSQSKVFVFVFVFVFNENHPTVKWAKLGSPGLSIPENLKQKLINKFLGVKKQRVGSLDEGPSQQESLILSLQFRLNEKQNQKFIYLTGGSHYKLKWQFIDHDQHLKSSKLRNKVMCINETMHAPLRNSTKNKLCKVSYLQACWVHMRLGWINKEINTATIYHIR